jgi:hypothetical protein
MFGVIFLLILRCSVKFHISEKKLLRYKLTVAGAEIVEVEDSRTFSDDSLQAVSDLINVMTIVFFF